jgi:hypothetical protein
MQDMGGPRTMGNFYPNDRPISAQILPGIKETK